MTSQLIYVKAAFEDFFRTFKSSDASLEDLTLDGDGTSDEYDFMDDDDAEEPRAQDRSKQARSKLKYMDLLQEVSNRKRSHLTVELDDLALVSASMVRKSLRTTI